MWKLNPTIYHLHDAAKLWNLIVKNALNKLQATTWRTDPSVFLWQHNSKLNVLLCTHFEKCDKTIKKRFTIGSEQLYGFQILWTKYKTKSIWNIFRSKWLNLLNWKHKYSLNLIHTLMQNPFTNCEKDDLRINWPLRLGVWSN